jgi:hypothetical protein
MKPAYGDVNVPPTPIQYGPAFFVFATAVKRPAIAPRTIVIENIQGISENSFVWTDDTQAVTNPATIMYAIRNETVLFTMGASLSYSCSG